MSSDTAAVLRPIIRYTRTLDGVAIAYTEIGDGPIPLVVAAPLIGQLEIAWEEPAFEQFMTRLMVGTRVDRAVVLGFSLGARPRSSSPPTTRTVRLHSSSSERPLGHSVLTTTRTAW